MSPVFAADKTTVARWDFGAEETTPLRAHGGVHRDVPGPRAPDYPDFEPNNTAVKLDGSGAYLSFEDPGAKSPFDFTNGDAITLEAWVQIDDIRNGENVYVIGKGRTGTAGFAPDNQNWALRVREVNQLAGLSFLFATPPVSGATKTDAHWHRWTTKAGFKPGRSWHHIAVSYRFGESSSVRAWIDGKPQAGQWDMGGETNDAPVVDDDAIWIGSSRGGAAANSFRGHLDAVAIHRQVFDDSVMLARYRRVGGGDEEIKPAPETMPVVADIPAGQVLLTIHHGLATHDRWLTTAETLPPEALRWATDAAVLERLPQRFDDWGIRDSWKTPLLLRVAADLNLSPGKHQFLMRVRGLSRLWVNGSVIARSKPLTGSPSGEEPMTPVAQPPLPGHRIAEHRQQEVIGEGTVGADGKCRVVLETIVGGKSLRSDPGELCLAILDAKAQTYVLLPANTGDRRVALRDRDIVAALARHEAQLGELDDRARRSAASSQTGFWLKRHQAARDWVGQHSAAPVPTGASHPIDAFLKAKMQQAVAAASQTIPTEAQHFYEQVLPILRTECFRCHGDKETGGLRLNTREAALKHGDSELRAVVPGKPEDSELMKRLRATDPDERMPPGANPLAPEKIKLLEDWIKDGAAWPAPPLTTAQVTPSPVINDAAFVRRVYLDLVGVPPTEAEARAFLADQAGDKRHRLIDRLLADERWADHWMSYWQDVLAENPTLVNSSLNTTGPFRWFLYDALRDNKPLDRLVTELILLRGSPHEGGSAGFGIAGDNDAPLAAKGQIVANAFLGIELQCARCHDSPYHSTKQRDLYALAAMFNQKSITVPKTSRVPVAFFEKKMRESLIKVTLKPDEAVEPKWPFGSVTGSADDDDLKSLMQDPKDSREQLAALITSPRNTRFSQVLVNRVWRRFIGAGFVEPVHDWEGRTASHPELLDWLAKQFVAHNYDLKHLTRLIVTSDVYQRAATGTNLTASPQWRFFAAPDLRRLTAEQILDSMHAAAGVPMDSDELTFDPDGRRASSNRLTLGIPRRAWMFANLANERDRPSLNLPRAQALVDILLAFGWNGARQSPKTDRETAPNVLQPGVLANSTASVLLSRAIAGSGLAESAITAKTPEGLVESLFLKYLSRLPSDAERAPLATALAFGFNDRVLKDATGPTEPQGERLPRVTWSNHLRNEANEIALELERRARAGWPGDPRLRPEWRETYEDVVWSVINIREFVWMP